MNHPDLPDLHRRRLRFQLIDARDDVDRVYVDETIDFSAHLHPGDVAAATAVRHGAKAGALAEAGIPTVMVASDPDGDIEPVAILVHADPPS